MAQTTAVIGTLADDVDPMVSVMKLEKAPKETYADVGGLDNQIQEIKVRHVHISRMRPLVSVVLTRPGSCRAASDAS